jgi:hypothetical protein
MDEDTGIEKFRWVVKKVYTGVNIEGSSFSFVVNFYRPVEKE